MLTRPDASPALDGPEGQPLTSSRTRETEHVVDALHGPALHFGHDIPQALTGHHRDGVMRVVELVDDVQYV